MSKVCVFCVLAPRREPIGVSQLWVLFQWTSVIPPHIVERGIMPLSLALGIPVSMFSWSPHLSVTLEDGRITLLKVMCISLGNFFWIKYEKSFWRFCLQRALIMGKVHLQWPWTWVPRIKEKMSHKIVVCLWEYKVCTLIPWGLSLEIRFVFSTETQIRRECKPTENGGRKPEDFSKFVFNLFQPIPKTSEVLGKLHFLFCLLIVLSILKYSLGNQFQKCFKESAC